MGLMKTSELGPYQATVKGAIQRARDQGLVVKRVWLSGQAHEILLSEISERDGRKHSRLFEAFGVRVEVDRGCPGGAGYLEMEADVRRCRTELSAIGE